jgi:PAS domain S-box-containing protein
MEAEAAREIFGHNPYAMLVEEVRDFAIFLTDTVGTIVSWNEGARRIFGLEDAEALGQPTSILFTPQDRLDGVPQQELERAGADGRAEDRRWHLRGDGRLFWANGVTTAMRDEAGGLRGFAKIARDDTERKLTEDHLRESEENLRHTIELNPQIPWTATPEGRIKDFSPRWLEMSGLTREDLLGEGWANVPHSDDLALMREAWERALRTGEPYDIEHRVRLADGSVRWMRSRALPRRDETGAIVRWYGTMEDIHERKVAEGERERLITELEFERKRLSHIFAAVPAFVAFLRGPEHVFDIVNPSYYQLVGHRELVGKPIREALPEIEGQGYFELLDRVFSTGEPFIGHDMSAFFQRTPGAPLEKVFVDFLYEPIFESDGSVSGIFVHGINNTQQVEARRAVEFERARLADIFSQAPSFVALVRGSEHRFEMANGAYLQLVGHRSLIGLSVSEALPEVAEQGFIDLLDKVFHTGETIDGREMPIRLQREPGGPLEERFVDFLYKPFREADGSISGVFAHGVDITDQVNARRQAEDANRIKDEFLATLSHELRTPLTSILGWARMLRNGDLDEGTTKVAIETIERNAQSQAQLIEDILDVSRVITGKLRIEIEEVDLAPVIEEAINAVLPAAQAKGVELQHTLPPDVSLVSGDRSRLQQVVWNLLSNAVKFTPRGGRVQARLQRVDSHVEIVVADTGQGIAPTVLPHIFERFRQADSTSTRKHGGLGLGLAIVRHLVELHGGTVQAHSEGEGKGATFKVKMPLIAVRGTARLGGRKEKRARPQVSEPFQCPPQLNDLHVLVVDDEEDARVLLRTVLESCGARVTAAASAPEALLALEKLRPDVLVSDIGMPLQDGYWLIENVRTLASERGGQTPAAALTAYVRVEDRTKILRSGFDLHMRKPVEPIELVTVVSNLARRTGRQ